MAVVVHLWILCLAGCSRAVPIVADPVTAPVDASSPVNQGAPLADKYFMDTSESAGSNCYRDVRCKPTGPKCAEKLFDAKWTAQVRAQSGDAWCCESSVVCEFPAK